MVSNLSVNNLARYQLEVSASKVSEKRKEMGQENMEKIVDRCWGLLSNGFVGGTHTSPVSGPPC